MAVGPKRSGRVALTDIHDTWVPNTLAGLEQGQLVKAAVLKVAPADKGADKAGKSGKEGQQQQQQLALSLRPSKGGAVHGLKRPSAKGGRLPCLPACCTCMWCRAVCSRPWR